MQKEPFRFKDYARYWAGEQTRLDEFAFLEAMPSMSLIPQAMQARARA